MIQILLENHTNGLMPVSAGFETFKNSRVLFWSNDVNHLIDGSADFVNKPSLFGCGNSFGFVRHDVAIEGTFLEWKFSNDLALVATDGYFEVIGKAAVLELAAAISALKKVGKAMSKSEEDKDNGVEDYERLHTSELLNNKVLKEVGSKGARFARILQSCEVLHLDVEAGQLLLKKVTDYTRDAFSPKLVRQFRDLHRKVDLFTKEVAMPLRATSSQKRLRPAQTISDTYLEYKAGLVTVSTQSADWDEVEREEEASLSKLGAAHATHALASGLSGQITTIDGSEVVLKGATKVTKIVIGDIEEEKIEQIQISFDLRARRLIQEGNEFVERNLPQIIGLLDKKAPLFNESDVDESLLIAMASKNRVELPGQVTKTLALVKGLLTNPFALYNGAPGIGKTHVAFSTVHLLNELKFRQTGIENDYKVLFSADGAKHLRKMERECKEVLGDKCIVKIIEKRKDIDELLNAEPCGKIRVYIVSKDTAKRATSFNPITSLKSCPDCGVSFTKKDARQRGYASNNGGSCGNCGTKLIVPNTKTATTGSFSWGVRELALPPRAKLSGFSHVESLSAYCARMATGAGKLFDLFIVDEAHNMSAEESAQATMMRDFITVSSKVLLLTGTLTNGYPSSVFHLLSAVMPKRLREWGFVPGPRGVNRWIDSYGARKTVTRRTRSGKVKTASEKAQISPQLVMHHLAPFTVWGKLEDLNYPMPKYTESVVITDVEPEILSALERGQHQAFEIFRNAPDCTRERSSALTKAMIYIGNNPTKAYNIDIQDKGEVLGTITIPALFDESYTTHKERDLLGKISESIAAGRKMMIYTFFNVSAETSARLEKVINRELPDISVGLLPSTIKSAKLEEWFEAAGNKHHVVLVPYKRVATGLDIPQFPDVIFYEEEYNIRDVMQAARRPYRAVIQKKDVCVRHLMQDGVQATAMSLIAAKMTASKIVEGETYSEEGIEAYAMDSIELELQKRLASGVSALVRPDFASTEVQAGRSRPWTKLEKRYLEIVKEINPAALKVIAPEEDEDCIVDEDSSVDEVVEVIEGVVTVETEEVVEQVIVEDEIEIEAINCVTLEPVIFRGIVMKKNSRNDKALAELDGDVSAMKDAISVGQKIQLAFF